MCHVTYAYFCRASANCSSVFLQFLQCLKLTLEKANIWRNVGLFNDFHLTKETIID